MKTFRDETELPEWMSFAILYTVVKISRNLNLLQKCHTVNNYVFQ